MHFSEAKRMELFKIFRACSLCYVCHFRILHFVFNSIYKGDPSPINIDPFYNNIPYIVIASIHILYSCYYLDI